MSNAPLGVFREGSSGLVMHKSAHLPYLCVKTGDAPSTALARNVRWVSPWVYIAAISPLIFIILAAVLSKQARVAIPVSPEVLARRRKTMIFSGISGVVVGPVFWFLLAEVGGKWDFTPLLVVMSIVAIVACAVIASRASQVLRCTRISNDYVWFAGVAPNVIQILPQWPGEALATAAIYAASASTWQWLLPGGHVLRAAADQTRRVEEVWIGQHCVVQANAGSLPDGHRVPLAASPGYRASSEAVVRFDYALGGCSLMIDGVAIAPMPVTPALAFTNR